MKRLLTPLNLNRIPKWIPIALIIIALIGFADAAYLTVEHYQNKIPPCAIGGCETVLTSEYSQIIGIPVSLVGSVYYLILLILLFLFLDTKKEIFLRIPKLLSILGALASFGFVYVMVFVIKEFCPYCAVSAVTSTLIFLLSSWSLYLSHYSSKVQE